MFPVASNLTSPFEQMHMSFCKRLLKLQKKTTTTAIYFELNWIPINISAQVNAFNISFRIANHSGNVLVTKAFVYSLKHSHFWTESTKKALKISNLQQVFFNADVIKPKTPIVSYLKNSLLDSFQKNAMDKIKHPTSKLCTYSKYLCSKEQKPWLSMLNSRYSETHVIRQTASVKSRSHDRKKTPSNVESSWKNMPPVQQWPWRRNTLHHLMSSSCLH